MHATSFGFLAVFLPAQKFTSGFRQRKKFRDSNRWVSLFLFYLKQPHAWKNLATHGRKQPSSGVFALVDAGPGWPAAQADPGAHFGFECDLFCGF
jgi:hypothetical protein